MESQVLFTGDISTYWRNTFLLGIMYSGFPLIIAGFSWARYLGLIMILFILIAVIYVVWTITPESKVIRFTDEDIIICDKGGITSRIAYVKVKKFEYNDAHRSRECLRLYTQLGSYSFNPPDGENLEKMGDGISKLFRSKNSAVEIMHYKYLDRWRNK